MNSNKENKLVIQEESQGPISKQLKTDPLIAAEEFNKKLSLDPAYLDLIKEIEDLKNYNSVLTETNAQLNRNNIELNETKEQLNRNNIELNETKEQLNRDNYRLTHDNEGLRRETIRLIEEIEGLKIYKMNHLIDNETYFNMIDEFVQTQRNLERNVANLVRPIRYLIPEYIPDYSGPIRCLVQLRNGQIASTTEDGIIRLWKRLSSNAQDESQFIEITTLTCHDKPILSLIELESGLLASGCSDSKINIYDTNSEEIIETLESYGDKVLCLLELSNKLIASGSDDRSILIWERRGLELKYEIKAILKDHHEGSVNALVELSEHHLVSGSSDGKINIWSLTDFKLIITLGVHTSGVTSLFRLSSGNLISGSMDRSMKVWKTSGNYECVATLTGHQDEVTAVIQLRNGQIASAGKDKTVRLWSSDNYGLTNVIEVCPEKAKGIYSMAELNNGMIAVGSSKICVINP